MDRTESAIPRWCAVVNPHAGGGRAARMWPTIEGLLNDYHIDAHVVAVSSLSCARDLVYGEASRGIRSFMAVGGDGTAHEALEGIVRFVDESGSGARLSDFRLAVIPLGSGNDWVKSHNLPASTESIVKLIAEDSFSIQDIVRVYRLGEKREKIPASVILNIGGVGLDAHICRRANEITSSGGSRRLLYVRALIACLRGRKTLRLCVTCDGVVEYEGPVLSMSIGVGRYSGGGMLQTPHAIMDDGLLDITIIPPLSMWTILNKGLRLFSGRIETIPEVVTLRARNMEITFEEDFPALPSEPMETDGEVIQALPVRLETDIDGIRALHVEK